MHLVSGLNLHGKIMSSNVIYPPHRIKLCTKAHVELSPFSLAEILCSQMQVYVCEQDHDVMKKASLAGKLLRRKRFGNSQCFKGLVQSLIPCRYHFFALQCLKTSKYGLGFGLGGGEFGWPFFFFSFSFFERQALDRTFEILGVSFANFQGAK
ncbi:hypothetical protein TWF706_004833 [Orbilia oligospora]|nr:hypothetical protein TWF706_004833 [Orbilia oligospora]